MLISGYSKKNSLTSVSGTSGLLSFTTSDTYLNWKGQMETAFFFHSHLSIFPVFFFNHSWLDLSEGCGHSHPHSLRHSSQSAELQMHWWAACGCRMRLHEEKVTSQEEKGEEELKERCREKDVTVQSAPSAQCLRCGLAPSSQTQLDPHIAVIYLERGERWRWERSGERERESGSGRRGREGEQGWKKKGKSKPFVFTHTDSLPETFDHISDSLLSSSQSHVKDWWGRWWTKINQSYSHSRRAAAKGADAQAFCREQSQACTLSVKSHLLWKGGGSDWSEAACCPLLSTLWNSVAYGFVLSVNY